MLMDESVLDYLKQKYNLKNLTPIQKGGFKEVFVTDRNEALKVVKLEQDTDSIQTAIKRVSKEFQLLKSCESNFLVKTGSIDGEVMQVGNSKYFVYSEEFLNGGDLRGVVKSQKKMSWLEIKKLCSCVCEALCELHKKKIVHRDIKPENIMRTDNVERPYVLLDLGIVYDLDTGGMTTVDLPRSFGTPGYRAPELDTPYYRRKIRCFSDIYSLGVTIYELMTHVRPVKAFDINEEAVQGFPSEFVGLLKESVKNSPNLRPENACEFLKKVEEIGQ